MLWIMGLGLALLGAPAQATPCDNSCGKKAGHDSCGSQAEQDECDSSSIQLKWLKWTGLSKKDGVLPPGLSKNDGVLPPGLSKKDDLPGLSILGESVPAIPEPTGLVLFGGGLLLAQAAARRRS
jgi:hypothetical protein